MSFLGKGVNKLFASLGSLFKKIVELTFNFFGFIKFKISKKSYARDESSRKGKIAGRKIKNSMDKFAIKAQVATDKGIIFLGKFLRLIVLGILKAFNAVSRGLYTLSEKSKDKFTAYCLTQDEKNQEKFIEFDDLIGKCDDIENYEEAAISDDFDDNHTNLDETMFNNINDNTIDATTINDNIINNEPHIKFKELDYNKDKNLQNKTKKENIPDLDKTLYNNLDKNDELNKHTSFDLDKTLYEDSNFYDSLNTSNKTSIKKQDNEPFDNAIEKDINSNSSHLNSNYHDTEDNTYENYNNNVSNNKNKFNFLKKKEKHSSLDETFHGKDYEFNSSIKLANENYSKDKLNSTTPHKDIESDLDKTQFMGSKSLNDNTYSDKTELINKTNFRDAVNSKLQSQYNIKSKTYKPSLDDDNESIRKFLSDDE